MVYQDKVYQCTIDISGCNQQLNGYQADLSRVLKEKSELQEPPRYNSDLDPEIIAMRAKLEKERRVFPKREDFCDVFRRRNLEDLISHYNSNPIQFDQIGLNNRKALIESSVSENNVKLNHLNSVYKLRHNELVGLENKITSSDIEDTQVEKAKKEFFRLKNDFDSASKQIEALSVENSTLAKSLCSQCSCLLYTSPSPRDS